MEEIQIASIVIDPNRYSFKKNTNLSKVQLIKGNYFIKYFG